ncbi:hypothetical protein GJ496_004767 [Pomphorhynchus laevis]|nr:hypothetical protein GJ496_004767 [Pomphorhynchus laevis]
MKSKLIKKEMRRLGKSVKIVEIKSDAQFIENVENSKNIIILDFYSKWLTDGIKEMHKPFVMIKIDVNKFPNIADRYNVKSVPVCIGLRDGKPISDQLKGFRSSSEVDLFLSKLFS